MLQLIARRRPNLSTERLREGAVSAVLGLSELAAFGMVVRLSHALGSKNLTSTYDRTFEGNDITILNLVYIALRLEHYDDFPERLILEAAAAMRTNAFGFRILRGLVVRYLTLFPTDFRLKQRLSSKLNLDFRRIRAPRQEQRLLELDKCVASARCLRIAERAGSPLRAVDSLAFMLSSATTRPRPCMRFVMASIRACGLNRGCAWNRSIRCAASRS